MKYDFLTPEERLAMLRPRLAGLERDHFNLTLDSQVSTTDSASSDPRVEAVEASLNTLREQAEALEAEIQQRES